MDPEPEIKAEVEGEITDNIEIVNCDMDVDIFEENPVKEEHDKLAITDVQSVKDEEEAPESVSDNTGLCSPPPEFNSDIEDHDNLRITDVKSVISVSDITDLCPNELLVYTTRLDDMQIWWNNLNKMYIEEVTEFIIKESKPKYTGHFENITHNEQHRRTFSSLKDKIEEINCLASHTNIETINLDSDPILPSERSKALLRACKPLSIVLQDCMIKESFVKHDQVQSRCKENISHPLEIGMKFTPKLNDDISRNIRDCMLKNKTSYVLLQDLCSKESAIYFISNDVNPTEYYRLSNKNKQGHYINLNSMISVIEIDNCCWYKRKKIINELTTTVCCRSIFMKTPHTCAPDMCNCCCKKRHNDAQTTPPSYIQPPVRVPKRAVTLDASQNNTWQDNLLKRSQDVSRWINKALVYKAEPRHKNRKRYQKAEDGYDINTILQIEHFNVTGLISSFYAMGAPDGNIDTYVELSGALNFTEKSIPFYFEKSQPRSTSHACCWYQYNMFVSQLTTFVPPSVVKFMKRLHKCAPRKCVCCCKSKAVSAEKMALKLCPINFPTQLKYTNNYGKKLRQRSSIATTASNHLPTLNVVSSRKVTLSTTSKVPEQPTVPQTFNRNIASTNSKINQPLVTSPPSTVSKTDSRNITPTSLKRNNIKERPITTTAVTQTDSQTKPSDDILNRVLNGLQGLSIVLHSDNTVTADLNGIPDNLSTEHLKILKLLLRYADAYMRNRKFKSNKPIRISNIFSSARKKVGVVEFPTIVLDDDDDDYPPGGDDSSSSTFDHSSNTSEILQTSQNIPSQQIASGAQIPTCSNINHFQDQFVKNIERLNTESNSPECEQLALTGQTQDQYALCTNILYDKRVQYYNSVLSLLNSGNENLTLTLNVPLNKGKTSPDLASCIVEFQCFEDKTNSKVGQKRKALNDINHVATEKRNKIDTNTISVPLSNMTRLPIGTITLPSGVNQITNLQGNLSTDSKTITVIPVTFVNPESGQTIANIPLTLFSTSGSPASSTMTGNTSGMVVEPMQSTETVLSVDPLQKSVDIPPNPVNVQTQNAIDSTEKVPENNILLSRLLEAKTHGNVSEPRLISVESENNIITGIINNQESSEDVSILGV